MSQDNNLIRITHVYRPKTLEEWIQLAKILSTTSFCPRDLKGNANETLACLLFGTEAGLSPVQALQNISTGRGKPSITGDAALALALGHPHVQDIQEWVDGKDQARTGHSKMIFRKEAGRKDMERTFSMAEATKAGLIARAQKAKAALERKGYHDDSPPWLAYPDRMLIARARGFLLRDAVPDALKGLILREEAQDYPEDDARSVERQAERAPDPAIQRQAGKTKDEIRKDMGLQAPQTPQEPPILPEAQDYDSTQEPPQDAPPAPQEGQDPEGPARITEKQRRMLWAIAKKHGKDMGAFKEAFKVAHLEDLLCRDVDKAKAWLEDPEKGKSPIPGKKKDAPPEETISAAAAKYLRDGMSFCDVTDTMFKAKTGHLPEDLPKALFNKTKDWLSEKADAHAQELAQKEGA